MAYTATGTTKGGRDGRAVLDDGARHLANATNRFCHLTFLVPIRVRQSASAPEMISMSSLVIMA